MRCDTKQKGDRKEAEKNRQRRLQCDLKGGAMGKVGRSTYSVVMMGLRPSFFRFLLMAAVAALVVVVDVALLMLLLLRPFAGPDPAAPVIDGAFAACACACACTDEGFWFGLCILSPGRAVAAFAPAPALSFLVLVAAGC